MPPTAQNRAERRMLYWAGAIGVGLLGLGALCGPRATAPPAAVAARPTADVCADAPARVQAYKAPSARYTLQETVLGTLLTERPIGQPAGWVLRQAAPPKCYVVLRVLRGNEGDTPTWALDTSSGRVTAEDDLAKRLSGW